MIRNILPWIIAFALSMIISFVFGAQQGIVFLISYIVACVVFLIASIVLSFASADVSGHKEDGGILALWNAFIIILVTVLAIALSWIGSMFFGIDFFVAYQLVTLGQCLMWSVRLSDSAPRIGRKTSNKQEQRHCAQPINAVTAQQMPEPQAQYIPPAK